MGIERDRPSLPNPAHAGSRIPQSDIGTRMATHLRITGTVQGVGYRATLCAQARAAGLTGWVRNRRDGSVEAVVDGPAAAVAAILAWARRGPPAARVADVAATEVASPDLARFEQRPTA